jgi:hypothetical protein
MTIQGLYKHYKGNHYLVMHQASHTETLEHLVVYADINELNNVWVRPLKMFLENVTIEGKDVPRFEKIEIEDES